MHALFNVHNDKCTNTNSSQQRERKQQLKYSDKVYSISFASLAQQNHVEKESAILTQWPPSFAIKFCR